MNPNKPLALIVDDDPLQLRLLEAALAKLGVASETFATAKEFVARLKTANPALCFIDLNLEREGLGYTIIEAVRHARGWDPVLIVFSGETSPEAIAHAMEVGADDYVTKPLIMKTLAEKVANYVTTAELSGLQPALKTLGSPGEARLELDFTLARLDELGVQLVGPHLLPKGLVVRLSGGPVAEATGRKQGVLVTIISTTADATRGCTAVGEFDSTDEPLISSVRSWLADRA